MGRKTYRRCSLIGLHCQTCYSTGVTCCNLLNWVYCFSFFFSVAAVCCSSRYGLALLSCYAFFVVYSLRVNLSVAMVDMLNNTQKSSTNHSGSLCPAHNSPERPKHNQTVS